MDTYSQVAGVANSPSISQQSRKQILVAIQPLLKPTSVLVNGLRQAIQGLVSGINRSKSTPSLSQTPLLNFIRCVEALVFYNLVREQIVSGKLSSIGEEAMRPRIWDLINKNSKWKAIADRKNVDKMFRVFEDYDGPTLDDPWIPKHNKTIVTGGS